MFKKTYINRAEKKRAKITETPKGFNLKLYHDDWEVGNFWFNSFYQADLPARRHAKVSKVNSIFA